MPRSSTTFTKENPRPGPGRPGYGHPKRIAKEAERKAVEEVAYDLKARLVAILPTVVSNIETIVAQAKKKAKEAKNADAIDGTLHVRLLDSIGDRLYGKPPQAITGSGGGPLLVSFTQLVDRVDGNKQEKF